MRVIAGAARGHKLFAIPGCKTRPTTDRVKEAIFSMIGPFFDGGRGLDLFAGTGGLGIEALSRGLDKVVFIDHDRTALKTIQKNLETTHLTGQAEIYRSDVEKALLWLRKLQFDIIFLDPPYAEKVIVRLLEQVAEFSLLRTDGVIVVEHPVDQPLPERIGNLNCNRTKKYGDTQITLFHHG